MTLWLQVNLHNDNSDVVEPAEKELPVCMKSEPFCEPFAIYFFQGELSCITSIAKHRCQPISSGGHLLKK